MKELIADKVSKSNRSVTDVAYSDNAITSILSVYKSINPSTSKQCSPLILLINELTEALINKLMIISY